MNKDFIINVLSSLGYTEKETQVYLASLSCGIAPSSALAKQAKLNRVTTYEILKKLRDKGLVSVSIIKDVKHFSPLEPSTLLSETQQRLSALEKSLPYLNALQSPVYQQHTVQLFEGLKGIKQAYRETLKSKTEILGYANSQNLRQHWPEYDEEYVRARAEAKIFFRGLAPNERVGQKVHQQDAEFYREIRLISRKKFSVKKVENEILLFDGRMLIVSFSPEPFAILVESSAVYETQKQIFEMLWEMMGE